ncbi:MAG: hypothetical protein HY720_23305 [Planctomycetes bacterium]|nr:hypothetical protein [Planctomycetota bacterium]
MILIVTGSADKSADAVLAALDRRGAPWVRFDTDDLPLRASVVLDPVRRDRSALVLGNGRQIAIASLRAAWLWKGAPHDLPENLAPAERDLVDGACQDSLAGLFGLLADHVLVVNPPGAFLRAHDKARQLRVAREAGLAVPETLITNSPDAARDFCERLGRVVFKMVNRSLWTRHDPDIGGRVFTRLLGPGDVEGLGSLQGCPGILQEFVEKRFDIRVTVVGGAVLAAEIHSQADPRTAIDFRHQVELERPLVHRPHALPDPVAGACLEVVRRLGLVYGAIDLVLAPDGRYVFLEVNPSGTFAWVEELAGLPISERMAELLARGASGQGSARPGPDQMS